MSNEAKPKAHQMLADLISERDRLAAENKELVSMLKSCAMALHMACGDSLLLKEARDLLAKVKEQTNV